MLMRKIFRLLVISLFSSLLVCGPVYGQTANTKNGDFQNLLQRHIKLIKRSSVKTIAPVFEDIQTGQYPGAEPFLQKWQAKQVWYRKADERLFFTTTSDNKTYKLIDIETGIEAGTSLKRELKQIKPNSGVRALISAALVRFRLIR